MTTTSNKRPIAAIRIGPRHRKDPGDLAALAESIKVEGLLQPIGVTEADELVFGERRLLACRDILGWDEIDVRVVNVTSLAAGEFAENVIRKDFTPSERAAILATIERMQVGDNQFTRGSVKRRTLSTASKLADFSSRSQSERALRVIRYGIPELVAAMDAGKITITAADQIRAAPRDDQAALLAAHLAKPPRVEPGRRSKAEQRRIGRVMRLPIVNPVRAAEFLFTRRPGIGSRFFSKPCRKLIRPACASAPPTARRFRTTGCTDPR